jgi:hypothetical protein
MPIRKELPLMDALPRHWDAGDLRRAARNQKCSHRLMYV